ncbi:MAG TPA: hypothetical protein VL460_03855 [Caulobacteraceae bacterium]|jgi:hypothetical protein|nr:hypothetical protein [Caulobacteraceae bacterium]
MPTRFEGFPRTLERSSLRPGRWFSASFKRGPTVCFATGVGEGAARTILTFKPVRADELEFMPVPLAEMSGAFATIEDELVLAPGLGPDAARLIAPEKRPFLSGSLLRLSNGDMGMGYADGADRELVLVSLSTGERASGFDLVFDRWSLSLRRGASERMVGCFRGLRDRAHRFQET